MLIPIISVQPLHVVEQIERGNYTPRLDKSFAKENSMFLKAYTDLKTYYTEKTGVDMSPEETGIWGFQFDTLKDNKTRGIHTISSGVVCIFYVEDKDILFSNYDTWEEVLDGSKDLNKDFYSLFIKEGEGVRQAYFSIKAVRDFKYFSFD